MSAQKDKDTLEKCAAIIRDAGATQTKMTSTYFAEGEKLKAAVRKLQEAWTDQMETQHHMKEGVTRCQPTVACVPSPCRGEEPSNPCEVFVCSRIATLHTSNSIQRLFVFD